MLITAQHARMQPKINALSRKRETYSTELLLVVQKKNKKKTRSDIYTNNLNKLPKHTTTLSMKANK